ncbi:MAG: type II toxin-antitoxin system VapC family toxin [Caldilineaceae bacterium]|nr:type II toxin-antitoxin system VapC family toxin [Caldilineaceae bacterium]
MNGRYLLDTNIVIALFANDPIVIQQLTAAREVFVPSIVLGELYYGVQHSLQVTENLARIEEFRAASAVLVCDATTAKYYGEAKAKLKRAGTPIPENDIWIAAIARQHDLTVVSRDHHFTRVNDLTSERW